MKHKIALIIGHSSTSPGASNATTRMTEFDYNAHVALQVWRDYTGPNELILVFRRSLTLLPEDINKIDPTIAISMHCNAFNQTATGTETLYYHRSETGKKLAKVFQESFVDFLKLPDRGIKPIDSEARGGYLLKNTIAPTIICEPFFIDNNSDIAVASVKNVAAAYSEGLRRYSI